MTNPLNLSPEWTTPELFALGLIVGVVILIIAYLIYWVVNR